MESKDLIEQLRNPAIRSQNLLHPSGQSEVIFNVEEVNINAETWSPAVTVTYSSVPCMEVVTATIVFT